MAIFFLSHMDVDFGSLLMLAGFYSDDFGWFFDRWLHIKGVEKNWQTFIKNNDIKHKSLYNG